VSSCRTRQDVLEGKPYKRRSEARYGLSSAFCSEGCIREMESVEAVVDLASVVEARVDVEGTDESDVAIL
jgi:hypothetical protein